MAKPHGLTNARPAHISARWRQVRIRLTAPEAELIRHIFRRYLELRSVHALMRELGNLERREMGRWKNNRVENSHLPFRRRERAMLRFRKMKTLQKFASVHASLHNHFNSERHLIDRQTFKLRRSTALVQWQSIMA